MKNADSPNQTLSASASTSNERTGETQLPRLWLVGCIVLIFIQPLHLVLLPLIRYDEALLPAYESIYMFSVSLGAWRDLIVAIGGVWLGIAIWRQHPQSKDILRTYLMLYLFSAALLVLLPFLIPFHSFLRKPIRLDHAERFVESLIRAVVYLFLFRTNGIRAFLQRSPSERPSLRAMGTRQLGMASLSLLAIGFSVAARFTTPIDIFEAAWEGDFKAVQGFIARGEDVNKTLVDASIALHLARTKDIADTLLFSPLRVTDSCLLELNDIKDIQGLVSKFRTRTNAITEHIWSRLSLSTREMLIDSGTSLAALGTPLVEDLNKIMREHFPDERELFAGVVLSERTRRLSAQNLAGIEQTRLARLLLEDAFPLEFARYQIDWRDLAKNTPLHDAAFNARLDVARLLIDCGADVNAANIHGRTPLDFALFGKSKHRKGDFEAMIVFLLQKGGRANTLQNERSSIAKRWHPAPGPSDG